MMKNYFVGLIENLGVVPLFLFAAFRFLPLLFVFLLRIAFVCFVFDAIIVPYLFRGLRFHNLLCFVKASLLISLPVLCVAQSSPPQNLYLAKGEQVFIDVKKLQQFSVGNPEILGRTYSSKKNKIYLKGKKLGYSDVVVWASGKQTTYHAYVISKSQNLKLAQVANSLKDLGFEHYLEGSRVWGKGTLNSFENLSRVQKIQSDYKKQVFLEISYTPELLKKIYSEIFLLLFNSDITQFECSTDLAHPTCSYTSLEPNKKLEENVQSTWGILLNFTPHALLNKNLKVHLKLIEVESLTSENFALGFQQLASTVKNFLDSHKSLYQDNSIQLNGQDYKMKVLAEPEIQTILGKNNLIQMGLNIPYQSKNKDQEITTEWLETGLKIQFKLESERGRMQMGYSTQLSSPNLGEIKTSHQQGFFFLDTNHEFIQFFQIGLKSLKKDHQAPLGIKNIPIIGSLFSSHAHSQNYKYFIGFVRVTHE